MSNRPNPLLEPGCRKPPVSPRPVPPPSPEPYPAGSAHPEEERLADRVADLKARNLDLESFLCSVSHDLQTALRAINGYTRILQATPSGEDPDDDSGDDPPVYLARILAAEQRAKDLLDALLRFRRVSQAELRRESVDLGAMAHELVDLLRQEDPGRQVSFIPGNGLAAEGDPRLLRSALAILLGNAWKYTRGRALAVIEIGCEEREGQKVYLVRDNGAGFDMQYAHRLFLPFERLHLQQQFEGTGIGLTTVERIIRRHGGRIWAEGEVGRGACFRFTLG